MNYINSETSHKVKRWKLAYDFDIQHIPVHWMHDNNAHLRVDTSEVAQSLAKLMTPTEETIQWMDDYHILEDAVQDISPHHNAVVGHHGVQRTIERLMRERALVQRYIDSQACQTLIPQGSKKRSYI